MTDHTTPGVFCVQLITDVPDSNRLDFACRDAASLDDAFGHAREAIATHPDFRWDGIIIWKDRSVADIRALEEEAFRRESSQ